MALEHEFEQALASAQLDLELAASERLQQYCHRLWDWNSKLNLTRHLDFASFVNRDLLDTLKLAELIEPAARVLDVGSGGGVPGIPLAILRTDIEVSLCECIQKKAHALAGILSEINVSCPVYADRLENVLQAVDFNVVTGRAIGPLWKILKWVQPHWGQFDQLLLHKGPKWVEERADARSRGLLNGLSLRKVAEYRIAGHDADSVILSIQAKA